MVVAIVLASFGWTLHPAAAGSCSLSPGVFDNGWVIVGTQANDTIDCSSSPTGRDIVGLGGDDVIIGSDLAPDVIVPGDGMDTVRGGGGPGDVLDFIPVPGPVTATTSGATNDGYGTADTYTGIEDLIGSAFDDSLGGDGGTNILRGAGGGDVLAGGGGPDVLDGGGGVDEASFADAAGGVTVDLARGIASGDGDDIVVLMEAVAGSDLDDVLLGSNADDRLNGRGGVDLLEGFAGDDELVGGRGHDTLIGGSGRDALAGGPGIDACASGPGPGTRTGCEAQPFGEAQGVVLFQPSRNPVGVGFHESLFSTAVPIRPNGRLLVNANPARFSPQPEIEGLPHVVMASRGRAAGATTSADVVLDSRSPVLSPVTGRVAMVRHYLLYCLAGDWQVFIRPDADPDLLVMILHSTDIAVQEGDRVIAAVTRVGTSWGNDLPTAEENLYFPSQYPHVHIEVEEGAATPVPGCL